MDAAAAYMEWMERLYEVDLAMAAYDGNNGGGDWGGKARAPLAAMALLPSMVRCWQQQQRWRRKRRRGWWTKMATMWPMVTGGLSRMATAMTASGAPHPTPGG